MKWTLAGLGSVVLLAAGLVLAEDAGDRRVARVQALVKGALPLPATRVIERLGEEPGEPTGGDGQPGEPATDDGPHEAAAAPEPGACSPTLPDEIASDGRAVGDLIAIWKADYKLGFYRAGALVDRGGEAGPACFDVALGFAPRGHKTVRGDGKTPEGWYWVSWKIPLGRTSFYKALYVSYPNERDGAMALAEGRIDGATHDRIARAARNRSAITDSPLGSLIEIHGEGSWPRNWTLGCVALDNVDMDWLFDESVGGKTAIHILP